MEKEKAQKIIKKIMFQVRIVFRGLCKMLYGSAVAGLIALAVYGFVCINNEPGWDAVSDFVISCATLAVAALNIYIMGRPRKAAKNG